MTTSREVLKMLRITNARLATSLDWPHFPRVNEESVLWFPSGDSAAIITAPRPTLERLYLSDFLNVSKLTTEEWRQLEKILGVRIPGPGRKLISQAIKHFVTYHCLKQRQPAWSEIKRRLEEIKETGEQLLELCRANPVDIIGTRKKKSMERGTARYVLSVDQVVGLYLAHVLPGKTESLIRRLQPICAVVEACDQALVAARRRASKRGRKRDVALNYLVTALVFAACRSKGAADFTLPSPKTKNFILLNYPLLAFVRRAIEVGSTKGLAAITTSTRMAPDEIRLASNALNAAKDPNQHRGIVDLVRNVQSSLRAKGTLNSR
jgi:hypothetical protein